MRNFIFLGFACSEEEFENSQKYQKVNFRQTYNFSHALLAFIRSKGYKVINDSYVPGQHSWKNFINRNCNDEHSNIYSSFLFLKEILIVFNVTKNIFRFKPTSIFVHGLYVPFLLPCALMKVFFKYSLTIVLTDKVNLSSKKPINLFLRKLNQSLIFFLLKSFQSSISLSRGLSDIYLPNKPSLIVPGFIPSELLSKNEYNQSIMDEKRKINITYSGALEQSYGILDFYKAFKLSSNNEIVLNVCGSGALNAFFLEESKVNDHLSYYGFLDREELDSLYKKTDVFINPRKIDNELVFFSSPSKIFEYLCFNKPVYTTNLPTIEDPFSKLFYFFNGDTVSDYVEFLDSLDKHLLSKLLQHSTHNTKKANNLYNRLTIEHLIK